MTVVESRLKKGKLTLGATPGNDYSCQCTNVRIKSNYNTDDGIETLCGDEIAGSTKLKGRSLAGTAIQDFDDPAGFVNYCFDNDLEVVAFSYTPNLTGAPTYTGQLRVQVPDETAGGDINTRLTSDFDWQISNLTRAYPPPATGATAGSPGTFTPAGAVPPLNLAGMTGITATPTTLWTTGEYVTLGDGTNAFWNATAWTAGTATFAASAEGSAKA